MEIKKITARIFFFAFLGSITLIGSGYKSTLSNPNPSPNGIFTCVVNEKPFIIENIKAVMRNTTGGRIQLSLSNDRFVKFFFINPEIKDFDLSTTAAREAIVRYNEPGTNLIYIPKSGHVKINQLDQTSKSISGTFEMELIIPGKDKVIKVTKGEFRVPIINVR